MSFSLGGYRGVLDVSHAPTSDGGLVVMRMRYSGSTCGCLLRGGRAGSSRRVNRRLRVLFRSVAGPPCDARRLSNAAMPATLLLVLREARVSCDGAFGRLWRRRGFRCTHRSLTLVWLRWFRACLARSASFSVLAAIIVGGFSLLLPSAAAWRALTLRCTERTS